MTEQLLLFSNKSYFFSILALLGYGKEAITVSVYNVFEMVILFHMMLLRSALSGSFVIKISSKKIVQESQLHKYI